MEELILSRIQEKNLRIPNIGYLLTTLKNEENCWSCAICKSRKYLLEMKDTWEDRWSPDEYGEAVLYNLPNDLFSLVQARRKTNRYSINRFKKEDTLPQRQLPTVMKDIMWDEEEYNSFVKRSDRPEAPR